MATIPAQQAPLTYESRKLREVLLPLDVPSSDESAPADPPYMPTGESPRTRRLRDEIDSFNLSAVLPWGVGFAGIVVAAVLFF